MPVLEVEITEDGGIGKLPEPLQKFLDKRIDEAYRKGADKTERALSPLTVDPVEMERLRQRDKLLADVELKEAERQKEYEKAAKLRDEAAAKERDEAVKAERKKTQAAIDKVRESAKTTIRAAALAGNARAESLEELERLLAADIDLDESLTLYVVDPTDRSKPRVVKDGDKDVPVTIEGLVAEYLKTHPHHVAAPATKPAGARGGATLAGQPPKTPSTDARQAARDAVAETPSIQNISKLLRAATTAA